MKKIFKLFIKNAEYVDCPEVRFKYGKVTSIVGIVTNLLLSVIKFLAGFLSGSFAVMADAFNNLSDASTSVVSLIGFKLSSMPADKEHPYGHGRYEYLSAFIVSIAITFIGFELLKSGVENIINPQKIEFSIITICILCFSVLVKILLAIFNHSAGNIINSNTLRATAQDSRNDAIATSVVLISLIVANFFSVSLDGYMTVAVAVFIMLSGFGIIKDTLSNLLGKPPEKERIEQIKNKLLSYEGVLGIHDLIVHDYGVKRQFASVHIEMKAEADVIESHELIDKIEKDFLEQDGLEIVIHYDPVSTTNQLAVSMREFLTCNVKNVDASLSVHDVRVVEGVKRNIVIFDCVVPYNLKLTEGELKQKLLELVKSYDDSFDIVVTFDKCFV